MIIPIRLVLLNLNAAAAYQTPQRTAHLVPHKLHLQPRHSFALHATQRDDDVESVIAPGAAGLALFAGVPAGALVLQALYAFKLYLPLLVLKRVYIYAMAAFVVSVGGSRGGADPASLGTRIEQLTLELLPEAAPEDLESIQRLESIQKDLKSIQKLDAVDDTQQAVLLPVVVGGSLVLSLGLLALTSGDSSNSGMAVRDAAEAATSLAAVSTAGTLFVFTRAEVQRADVSTATVLAVELVGVAYLLPAAVAWPVQNMLCLCLAVATARALQFSSFAALCAVAAALVAYDVASVAATLPVAAAAVGAKATTSAAAASPMGAVAVSRLAAEGFQPGLLQVRLGGRISDVLGLGDAVFPALVAGFAKRYDLARESRLFPAALAGFGVACVLCELSPGIDGRGLPALLYILPVMVLAVLATAAVDGEDVFGFEAE